MSAQPSEFYPIEAEAELRLVPNQIEADKPHIGEEEARYLLERGSLLSRQAARVGVLKSVNELKAIAPEFQVSPDSNVLSQQIWDYELAIRALDQVRSDKQLADYLAAQAPILQIISESTDLYISVEDIVVEEADPQLEDLLQVEHLDDSPLDELLPVLEKQAAVQVSVISNQPWSPFRPVLQPKAARAPRATQGAPNRGGSSVSEVDPSIFYPERGDESVSSEPVWRDWSVPKPQYRSHIEGALTKSNAFDSDPQEGVLDWQKQALCAQTDPEAFFPEKGGSTREAKRICVGCEVKQECLEYALLQDERFGISGGMSERERRRLKRKAG
jgi:WhiB family redox-sensing transcriptional regulator